MAHPPAPAPAAPAAVAPAPDLRRALEDTSWPDELRAFYATRDWQPVFLGHETVVPALLDVSFVVGLVLAITNVGQAHLAAGLAAAAIYHAVPRALGWPTVGGFVSRLATDRAARSKAPRSRESLDLRKMQAAGALDSRLIVRSVDGTQSRRAG